MPTLYVVIDRSTGAELGRGTWVAVREAMRLAARQGVAADVRRAIAASKQERDGMYLAARSAYLRRAGAK